MWSYIFVICIADSNLCMWDMEKNCQNPIEIESVSPEKPSQNLCSGIDRSRDKLWSIEAYTNQRPLQDFVTERRFKLAGHTLRQAGTRPAKWAMNWIPVGCHRKRCARRTWRSTYRDDLKLRGLNWTEAKAITAERLRWGYLAAHCHL